MTIELLTNILQLTLIVILSYHLHKKSKKATYYQLESEIRGAIIKGLYDLLEKCEKDENGET